MKSKTILIVAGPTAVGKTSLAIDLARHFNTSVISADSRQCFRELSIGVAKPEPKQLNEIRHYFIDSHSIHDNLNAAVFEQYALGAANEIFQEKDIALMVGGTGLYIKAFCEGLDEIPEIPPGIRSTITDTYAREGLSWLQEQVRVEDPEYFLSGEIENPQRLMRALEVKLGTGKSIRQFQRKKKIEREFRIIKVALHLPKEQLHRNINRRVDEMIRAGLVQEVESLLPYESFPPLRTVGYTELFSYFRGELSLDQAVDLIKKNTRQYAKRQLTWFRKDADFVWCSPDDREKIIDLSQV